MDFESPMPLLYFPLYHSGHKAIELLEKIECSGYSIGEKFHTYENKQLLESQIFNRIAYNEYAKNFVLSMANINEEQILPNVDIDTLTETEKENLRDNLKVLIAARKYDVAKILVDYLIKAKENSKNFQMDEIWLLRGRIYNSLNNPLVAADSYKTIIENYPQSSFLKTAKIRYAISLQYAKQFEQSAEFVRENSLSGNINEDKNFQFWLYYLNSNYEKCKNVLLSLLESTHIYDTLHTKAFYWLEILNKNLLSHSTHIASLSINSPYPIFSRQYVEKTGIQDQTDTEDFDRILNSTHHVFKFYLISELTKAHLNIFAKFQIQAFLSKNLSKEEEIKLAYYSYLISDFTTASKLVSRNENFEVKNLQIDELSDEKKLLYKLDYPLAYWNLVKQASELLNLDPFWLLSVMRAESLYNTNAQSSVGAIGLMQIMPYTGIKIFSYLTEFNENKFSISMLREPNTSILFSAYYLKLLLENYKGNYILATAAYNAGPVAINRWIKQTPEFNTVEFFENIPYAETKKYVTAILRSMDMYSRIYAKKPLLLDFDVNKNLFDVIAANDLF